MYDCSDTFFSNIDARSEFEYILKHNKMKILYVRNNRNTRCKCFDPLHKDGDSKCKMCGGSGFLSSIELMEVFCNPLAEDDMLRMSGERFTEIGDANLFSKTFYLRHNTKPNTGDKVIVVGYDNHGLPTEIKEVFCLNLCREVRGINGRIEYFKTLCRTSPQQVNLEQRRLNNIPNEHKIKLMKGVRYQWGS